MRIEDLLRRNARRSATSTAIVCNEGSLTWAELDAASDRLASALLARGYRQHERIAVVLPNCHRIPIAYYAIWKCNMVSVAINPRLTAAEVRRILEHSGASAVICDGPAAVEAAAQVPTVREVIGVSPMSGATTSLEELDDVPAGLVPAVGSGSDLRSLRYTSGTTGQPKGCMATHEQQLASVSNFLIEVEVPRTAPTYLSVPMTLGVGAFYLTAAAYLAAPLVVRQKFRPQEFLADVERFGIAHAFLVPTMLIDLVNELEGRSAPLDTSLRLVGYGGAPISWKVVRAVRDLFGCDLYQGLGATEAGGYATLLTPQDHHELLAEDPEGPVPIGRAAAYARTRVVDADRNDVDPGATGELLISSASNFSGYWAQPEETAAVLRDGWLALGDVVREDERGFLHMVDRKQGVIRSGSQNVYAGEVEAVLMTCPGVVRAAAVGMSDERFGESVRALVVRAPGSDLDEQAVIDHCTAHLAGYKRPRSVVFVPEIPVDEGGKIQRARLAELPELDPAGREPAPADRESLSS